MEDMTRIAEGFGVKASCIYKTKYFYTVRSGRSEYRIIPTTLPYEKLQEIYSVKEALFSAGLRMCDRLLLTPDNRLILEGDEGCYIMSAAVKGHNLEFDNAAQMMAAFSSLGSIHKVLRQLGCDREDILSIYKKGAARLRAIKKQVGLAKKMTDVDISFIKNYADYDSLAQSAIATLEGLNFGVNSYIHGAVKEDNIFISRNVMLTDWELMRPGHYMEDTAQLISRYVRKFAYGSSDYLTLDEILSVYTSHNPVNDSDLAILYALLMYPKRYIAISGKYYSKSHKFTPVGVRHRFEESWQQKEFYLRYIGVGV